MEIRTIGFTKRSASSFFGALKAHGIRRLIDVRLNNVSQLSGFAKRADLEYFLRIIVGAAYTHEPLLAPTRELLTAYRKGVIDWETYAQRFVALLQERKAADAIPRELFAEPVVLLCSEATAARCHRRLVAEYLAERWGQVLVTHL